MRHEMPKALLDHRHPHGTAAAREHEIRLRLDVAVKLQGFLERQDVGEERDLNEAIEPHLAEGVADLSRLDIVILSEERRREQDVRLTPRPLAREDIFQNGTRILRERFLLPFVRKLFLAPNRLMHCRMEKTVELLGIVLELLSPCGLFQRFTVEILDCLHEESPFSVPFPPVIL